MKDNCIATEFFWYLSGNLLQPWSSLLSDCILFSQHKHIIPSEKFPILPSNVSISLNTLTDEKNANAANVAINEYSRSIFKITAKYLILQYLYLNICNKILFANWKAK